MKVWLEKKFFMSELKQISIMHFSWEELKKIIFILDEMLVDIQVNIQYNDKMLVDIQVNIQY